MKLMIVDDSLLIRNKISRSMLKRFSKIVRAENGVKAIEMVKQEHPTIITMDLTMPGIDGVEAIQKIVQIAPSTQILVVSALADKATAIKALTLGASGFLCKPFTESEIDAAIQRVMKLGVKA